MRILSLIAIVASLHAATCDIIYPIAGSSYPIGDGVPVVVRVSGGTATSVTVSDQGSPTGSITTPTNGFYRGNSNTFGVAGSRTITAVANLLGGGTATAAPVVINVAASPYPLSAMRLDPLAGHVISEARDMASDGSMIVGYSSDRDLTQSNVVAHACMWQPTLPFTAGSLAATRIDVSSLYATYAWSIALATNGADVIGIAGHDYSASTNFVVSLWKRASNGTVADLGVLRSSYAMPSHGPDVGRMDAAGIFASWSGARDTLTFLPAKHFSTMESGNLLDWHSTLALGGRYSAATALNSSWLYGWGTNAANKRRAVRIDRSLLSAEDCSAEIYGTSPAAEYSVVAATSSNWLQAGSTASASYADIISDDLQTVLSVPRLGTIDDVVPVDLGSGLDALAVSAGIPFRWSTDKGTEILQSKIPASVLRQFAGRAQPITNAFTNPVRIGARGAVSTDRPTVLTGTSYAGATPYTRAVLIAPAAPCIVSVSGPSAVGAGTAAVVTASASDPKAANLFGGISRVDFVLNSAVVATALSSPYTASIPIPLGTNTVIARAWDTYGLSTDSPAVTIAGLGQPQIALSTSYTSPTNAASMAVTVTCSEPVTGLIPAAFNVSNATISLSGGPSSFVATLTPTTALGSVSLQLPAAAVTGQITGLMNSASNSLSWSIDRVPPAVPMISGLTVATDSGASHTDGITNISAPVVVGTAEIGSALTLYVDGITRATVTPAGDGSWSWQISPSLAGGSHVITATASDALGNSSTPSGGLAVQIITTLPSTPTLAFTTAANQPNAHASGLATAGSSVQLALDGVVLPDAIADGSGAFAWTAASPLVHGLHTLTARVLDLAGNLSAPGTASVTIDTIAPTLAIAGPDIPLSKPAARSGDVVRWYVSAADLHGYTFHLLPSDVQVIAIGTANGTVTSVVHDVPTDTLVISVTIGAGEGTLALRLPAGVATDPAGNSSISPPDTSSVIVANTAPVLAVGSPILPSGKTIVRQGDTVQWTATATGGRDPVALSINASDVLVVTTGTASATITSATVSGSSMTVSVLAGAGDGSIAIQLPASVAVDGAGNASAAPGMSASVAVANVAPTVTWSAAAIPSSKPAAKPGDTLQWIATASAGASPMSFTLTAADISISSSGDATGQVMSVTTVDDGHPDQAAVQVLVTGGTAGTLSVSCAAGVALDAAGNTSPASGLSSAASIDGVPPTADITPDVATHDGSSSFTVAIAFSEPVTGLTTAGVQITGGILTSLEAAGDQQHWSAHVSATAPGDCILQLLAGAAQDAAGNDSLTASVSVPWGPIQPTAQDAPVILDGSSVSLQVRCSGPTWLSPSGTPTLAYAWETSPSGLPGSWTALSGSTGQTLRVPAAAAGTYLRVVVQASLGSGAHRVTGQAVSSGIAIRATALLVQHIRLDGTSAASGATISIGAATTTADASGAFSVGASLPTDPGSLRLTLQATAPGHAPSTAEATVTTSIPPAAPHAAN